MVARRLVIALLAALAISGIFTLWLAKKFSHPQAAVAKVEYVATAKPMDAGSVLTTADLKMVDWPSGSPLDGAYAKPQDLEGRTLLYPLAANQPITDKQISAAGSGAGLSAKIPDGMRAISVRSDEIIGVAGFLLPGAHVDVLVTYHTNAGMPTTSMVLQDVQVLATGQKMQPDPEGKPTTTNVVTLLVKPEDAEKVVLATAQGTVHFVLRNGMDHVQVATTDPQPDAAPKVSAAPAHREHREVRVAIAKPYTVQTVNGDKQSVETFQ